MVPKRWVVRRKEFDYGIDLEVEIFDDSDESTGLIFYVQLKATDDINQRTKVNIKRDHQEYLYKLDVVTIIVRYCAVDDSVHWRWHYTLPELKEGRKSQTVVFSSSDHWCDRTPLEIEKTLHLWRRVKLQRADRPVALHLNTDGLAPSLRQSFRTSVRRLVDDTATLKWEDDATEQVLLSVFARTEELTVSLGGAATLSAPYDPSDLTAAQSLLRYMLAAFLHRLGLPAHADMSARQCLVAQIPAPSAELAHRACRALSSDAVRAAKLAILNDLHDHRWLDGASFIAHLQTRPIDAAEKREARRLFMAATLKSAHDAGDAGAEGAAYYSLGNDHAMAREAAAAFSAFNKARKLRPEYMQTGYFLNELGGVLFGSRHFMASAEFYTQSSKIKSSQRLSLYLGDSLLMSGQFAAAAENYTDAQTGDSLAIIAEADLKAEIARWLEVKYGAIAAVRPSAARLLPRAENDSACECRILHEVDAMDGAAHWNLGVALAQSGSYSEALGHFLVCAFQRSGDDEAWMNALLCAFNMQDPLMLQRVLSCTLALGGPYMADSFCDRLANSDELVASMTSLIAETSKNLGVGCPPNTIIRILSREGY